jgi:large subunit ribosomal protein L23
MSTKLSPYDIIAKPVITEKATADRMENNKYVFYVNVSANKVDIKRAVEEIFGVTVLSVNTQNMAGKPKRMGKFAGKTSKKKKAVVRLKEGDRIKLMEGP